MVECRFSFLNWLNELLGGMYERLINSVLKPKFPHFHAATLLKLAYKMKGGKAVSLKDLTKMDTEMAQEVNDFMFEDEVFKEKMDYLRGMTDEYGTYFGIAEDNAVKGGLVRWVMFSIPETNIVAFSILPRWEQGGEVKAGGQHETFFYKIIMENGRPSEKVEDKVREIDHALLILNFVKDPCYKDKRDLKHSPYQYAIRKMPFLRILRKSFVGKAAAEDVAEWRKQADSMMSRAKLKSQ